MADYEHSTTAATLGTLPDPVRAALLEERASAAQLTLTWHAPAYLTRSRRLRKPGMLARLTGTADADTEHLTALVLGGKDVLVATRGERRGTRWSPRASRTSKSALRSTASPLSAVTRASP
jgi:hypothetical protein